MKRNQLLKRPIRGWEEYFETEELRFSLSFARWCLSETEDKSAVKMGFSSLETLSMDGVIPQGQSNIPEIVALLKFKEMLATVLLSRWDSKHPLPIH